MDYKRLLIAIILSAGVLFLWPKVFPPPPAPARAVPTAPATTSPTSTAAPARSPSVPGRAGVVADRVTKGTTPVHVEPVGADAEREETVETPLYVARVSNRGGVLVSFRLRRYDDATKQPLDLVRHGGGFPGRTLAIDPVDPFLARAGGALFQLEREDVDGETILRLHYREESGEGVRRTWRFGPTYVVGIGVTREGATEPAPVGLVLGPGIGNPSGEEMKNTYTKPGATVLLYSGGSVTRNAKDGLKEPVPAGPGAIVAGLEDNYFLTAFLPQKTGSALLKPFPVQVPAAKGEVPRAEPESTVTLQGAATLEAEVFLGPKELKLMQTLRPGAEKLIDFGWFAILAKPLLYGLKWIQGGVGNWGVAIILITIIIKIVLFPLTYKQLISMKKMSGLQPKMEAVRQKWADKLKKDPQARAKMNEEVMGLYKQEGVNPAGGCLPLLLQMPILFAFYQMLAKAIELRHAPFWLWITDLSLKDAYYVTPILMTLTMWIQQQMTPSTSDATQKKILGAMPFVFGFMFKDMPSGLVLYWLVQNVLTIAQQMLLDRFTDLGPAAAAAKKKGRG